MSCLKNHIGLKYCNSPEPESGLYVNQLPGITLERIEKSSEKDNLNFLGAWGDIQKRAWLILEKDVRRQMRLKYKLRSVKSNNKISGILDETSVVGADGKYRGVIIDLGDKNNFLTIGINSISLWLPSGEPELIVKIFDQDGAELGSIIRQNPAGGKILLPVGKKYLSSFVFIATDCSEMDLFTSKMPEGVKSSFCGCLSADFNCNANVSGGEAELISPAPDEVDNLFGFEVDFSVLCDYSGIICRNKTEFTDAWLYLLGSELLLESINSTRLSWFNTVDRDNAIENREYFFSEYQRALSETIEAIEVGEDECCIECNPIFQSRFVLP